MLGMWETIPLQFMQDATEMRNLLDSYMLKRCATTTPFLQRYTEPNGKDEIQAVS